MNLNFTATLEVHNSTPRELTAPPIDFSALFSKLLFCFFFLFLHFLIEILANIYIEYTILIGSK